MTKLQQVIAGLDESELHQFTETLVKQIRDNRNCFDDIDYKIIQEDIFEALSKFAVSSS